jgi:hypothetical protein
LAGIGNTTNNPLFASGFRLSTNSPCINMGTNLAWMTGNPDLDGNPRIANGTADMGAYEWFSAGPTSYIWTAVEVGWYTLAGTNYQVQATTNLQSGQWQNLGGVTTGNGSLMSVFDSTRTNAAKFYRVVAQ